MAKRIMRQFQLDEISGVDRPAQKGALAVIMKRDGSGAAALYVAKGIDALPADVQAYAKRTFTADERTAAVNSGAAMPDGSFPIKTRADLENAIRLSGNAKDPAKAKSHIIARARAIDATSLLPGDWTAGKSVGGDLVMELARVAPRALPDLLDNVIKAEEIRAQIAKGSDVKLRKSLLSKMDVAHTAALATAWSILDSASPADAASLLQKNFAEYKDHIAGLLPVSGEPKGDEIMLKAIAKSLGLAETASEAEVTKALADKLEALSKAEAIAKMSGKHQDFMNNDKAKMPSGGKDAFMAMTPEQRAAHMTQNPISKAEDGDDDDDAEKNCIKVDGKTLHKRDIGDAAFTVMKAQQDRIEKAETATAIGTIAKRVEPLKFVIGKADETAAILHRVAVGKSTQADADAIEGILKSANEVMGKSEAITKEFGKAHGGGFNKAADAIAAKAAELKKADPKLSIEKARTMVRTMDPTLAKQEEEEARDARKAA